jgi:hypothetical protein
MKNKNTTPKPVNEENQYIPDYLGEILLEIRRNDLPGIHEQLDFYNEKFDTHRDKINEVATELNAMSEQTHERFLKLAEIDTALLQVMSNRDGELEESIKFNRYSIWALALIQAIILFKLFIP